MAMSAEEYLAQLKALLPPGPAWKIAPGDTREGLLAALADELARVDARAEALLGREADVRGAVELLPDWERAVGLPDACSPSGPTLLERQQSAHARLVEDGDVTEAGWLTRAAELGHTITLKEYTPSRAGVMQSGDELVPVEAVFELEIIAPTVLTHPLEAGAAQAGDPLGSFDTDRLRCELERVRQAHTHLTFTFTT